MSLSERATAYLQTLKRDPEWMTGEQETARFLERLNIPDLDPILHTQLNYSGYELTVHHDQRNTYNIRFISAYHIEKNKKIYTERVNDEVIVDFENDEKSYQYFITGSGRICTRDEDHPRKIHYTFESIETKIEQFALLSERYYFKRLPSTYWNVPNFEKLKAELSDLSPVTECCDAFSFCCMNENVLILVSPWLGSPGQFFSIYGAEPSFCKEIITRLERKRVIE